MAAEGPELSARLRDHCRYPRLTGEGGTVLFIEAGYFIERECREAFAGLGWRVMALPLPPAETFISRLLGAVMEGRPDLLFTVNHLGFDRLGSLARLLEAMELPSVSWFVDSPAYILLHHRAVASPLTMTPVWERSWASFLTRFGFEHVFHLPLAADARGGRTGSWSPDYLRRAAFVGDSMTEAVAKWRRRLPRFRGAETLMAVAARKVNETRGRDVPRTITATAEKAGVGLPALPPEGQAALETAVVLEATRLERSRMAAAMAPLGLELFGDDGWLQYAPAGVRLNAPVDYYTGLPEVYRQTAVNLNVTSLQMPTAVNQRVFDAPVAGGFLITDMREDLELLFDREREVATYQTPEELPDIADFYISRDEERRRMTGRAAQRIAAEHTYRHRIAAVVGRARKAFAGVGRGKQG